MSDKLSEDQIAKQIGNWNIGQDKIEKVFTFKDFKSSMKFVNKVADLAEKMNHHPEIEINYDKVEIELTTHSAGGITEKDIELANKIERSYNAD